MLVYLCVVFLHEVCIIYKSVLGVYVLAMTILLFIHIQTCIVLLKPSVGGSSNTVLKERVEMLETMCKYCGDKMESYLSE